jgi:aspartyl-tRNA(Asn)/glutamyl-tRNA(Gln) amidotransferase subunit A
LYGLKEVNHLKLYELTAHEIRDKLRKREISVKEVLDDTYSRVDSVESKINSYITLTREKAYAAAEKIDKAINRGGCLPDLAGIPMAIKDNICTEEVETTCASRILRGFKPPYSVGIREAGQ